MIALSILSEITNLHTFAALSMLRSSEKQGIPPLLRPKYGFDQ